MLHETTRPDHQTVMDSSGWWLCPGCTFLTTRDALPRQAGYAKRNLSARYVPDTLSDLSTTHVFLPVKEGEDPLRYTRTRPRIAPAAYLSHAE